MNTSDLEKRLTLQQKKLDLVLQLTQAINLNFSHQSLLNIYQYVIAKELGVGLFLLLMRDTQNEWEVAACSQENYRQYPKNIDLRFKHITQNTVLEPTVQTDFKEFSHIIPVINDKKALAYVLIGKLQWADGNTIKEMVDFMQALTNILVIANENRKFFDAAIEQEKLKNDLQLAKRIQTMLVPENLPDTAALKASAVYIPNRTVGGDYYDCQQISETEWIFCVADVTGKGISAALLMANLQANLRFMMQETDDLTQIVTQINKKTILNTRADRFVTLFIAKLNTQTGTLTYINAGHTPPLLYQNETIEFLKTGSPLLGILDHLPFINTGTAQLENDALLLIFTDGLSEIKNKQNQEFDTEALSQFAHANNRLPINQFNQKLVQSMIDYQDGNTDFADDVTILSLKYFKN